MDGTGTHEGRRMTPNGPTALAAVIVAMLGAMAVISAVMTYLTR